MDGDDQYPGCPDACPFGRACTEGTHPITPDETVEGCPLHLLDDQTHAAAITAEWSDWERGLSPHWPDGLAACVVEGVRLLHRERARCDEACMERVRERERRRRAT